MARKKKNEKVEVSTEDEKSEEKVTQIPLESRVCIRYNHFTNKTWPGFIASLIKNVALHSVNYSRYNDDKTRKKDINHFSENLNFHECIRTLKYFVLFNKIINLIRTHNKNFYDIKNNLLQTYGKYDSTNNQQVLLEDNIQKFNEKYDELLKTVVYLDIAKLSPKFIFDDFASIYESYYIIVCNQIWVQYKNLDPIDSNKSGLLQEPYMFSLFFDFLGDIFDIDEVFRWKYNEEVDNLYNKNFGL